MEIVGDCFHTEIRALRFEDPVWWSHHRGGWRAAVEHLQSNFHHEAGVRIFTAIEDVFFDDPNCQISEPWVAFVHQVPKQNLGFPDLERLVELPGWKRSIGNCIGLWSLTDYQRQFLKGRGVTVPIAVVSYPCETDVPRFDPQAFLANDRPKLVMVGEFLRKYQSLFSLEASGYRKNLLKYPGFTLEKYEIEDSGDVDIIDRICREDYDRLLAESVVFLDLVDSVANTTVIECLARNTPVLLNRSPGASEYLGSDYPLFFADLSQAAALIADRSCVIAAHEYLVARPKEHLEYDFFSRAVAESAVYRRAATTKRRLEFDLTIILNTYGRIQYLRDQLISLRDQNSILKCKMIIWNNNPKICDELSKICAEVMPKAHIISSNDNVFCLSRLALVPLVNSPAILIIDDDVIPGPGYVERFHSAWRRCGEHAVICARGHRFKPHPVNEERPAAIWDDWEDISFHDESVAEMEVHFAHADNLLIATELLREVGSAQLPWPEAALIDDYWMSYRLTSELGARLVKIQADDVLAFTASADDPDVAMFLNPRVQNERINFYIYHMDRGWPAFEGDTDREG